MFNKLAHIKWENISVALWIPIALIQTTNVDSSLLFTFTILQIIIASCLYMAIQEMRKEFRQNAKTYDFKIKATTKNAVAIIKRNHRTLKTTMQIGYSKIISSKYNYITKNI